MMSASRVGLRWTIGNVSRHGFDALRLSIRGAWKVFGPAAAYAVCVNSVPLGAVRAVVGDVPEGVTWHESTRDEIPSFLISHLDAAMAEGVAWKFAPLEMFPDRFEIALDNDCILWRLPSAIKRWLEAEDDETCIIAEDVRPCFGQFAHLCGPAPRNSGIRGLPPHYDFEGALRRTLHENPTTMASELDEQGLQVAAVSRARPPLVVTLDEVTICSPFPPHLPYLGTCGAHFVGLNARHIAWELDGKPATTYIEENWNRLQQDLRARVDISVSGHAPAS
jgi:hypothetical protein